MKSKLIFNAKKSISFFIALIMITGFMLSGVIDISVNAVTTTYQASAAFNDGIGIQGKNQWYYQQWNGSSYTNLSWDNTNQRWQGAATWLLVSGSLMHPEASLDAVRKWVAPCDGSARIYGNVKKNDTGGGDGVLVAIVHNSTNIWGTYTIAYNDSTGLNHDVTRDVKAGDAIYFYVSKNNTIWFDGTTWDPSIDFTPLSSGNSAKEWNYTTSLDGFTGYNCTISASGGYLNGTNTNTPIIFSSDNLNIDITKSCVLKIRMKNSTSSTYGAIYYTTIDDSAWTQSKCKAFSITPNDANYTEYTIDMSGVYGWMSKIKQLRINPNYSASGTFSIDYVKLQAGGANAPVFSLLDKETVLTNSVIETTNGMSYYNDSNYGILRNSDATYKFFGSNGGTVNCSTISNGTLDNPFSGSLNKNVAITGMPGSFGYACIGAVYRDPADANTIMGFVHLERHYTVASVPHGYCSIGIAISRDNASTWDWCGEIISSDTAFDDTSTIDCMNAAGAYLIQNVSGTDYFYVYSIDQPSTWPSACGLSVARAPVSTVLAAAKNETVTSWYKYYNSTWTQPGLNGSFTNLVDSTVYMNYLSVSYNSYLGKYLLSYCYAQDAQNIGDISLIIADSCLDFDNNATEYVIDAGSAYAQYPTIVGLGNSNPQTESQKNFYIYYTQWADSSIWSSDTKLVRKMVVLD
ncbi:MAG: hypothetical protein ACYCYI_11660 [Saccharofermentanales bacterium]